MIRRLRKVKEVKEIVQGTVAEKAAVLNPLSNRAEETPSVENVPRITNETITEHREEVLKGARKYIYPLQHSKHRIVTVTITIAIAAIISLLVYCGAALYRYYQYNTFLYRVTQVVPFPIAKAGGSFVNYENYLFELRHYVHYYQTQQGQNFTGTGREQLLKFRKQALQNVVDYAYIKTLAKQNNITVSDKEVSARIAEVRDQNRLGSDNKVFADVLRDYWGWSIDDFKRSLKQEILAEKVTAKLDTATAQRSTAAYAQLKSGADFSTLAKTVSDDPTAASNGGDYGFGITKTNPNVPPEVINTLFQLQPGQYSGVVLASPVLATAGPTLEIVKVVSNTGGTITAQHMSFNLKNISVYINNLKAKQPEHLFVKF